MLSDLSSVLLPWWSLPLDKVYDITMIRQPEVLTVLGLVDLAAALSAASDGRALRWGPMDSLIEPDCISAY